MTGQPRNGIPNLKEKIDTNNDEKFSTAELKKAIESDQFSKELKIEFDNLNVPVFLDEEMSITQERLQEVIKYLNDPQHENLAKESLGQDTLYSTVFQVMKKTLPPTENERFFKDKPPQALRNIARESLRAYYKQIGALPATNDSRIFTSIDKDKIPDRLAVKPFKDYIATDNSTQSFSKEADSFGSFDSVSYRQKDTYLEIPGKEIAGVLEAGKNYLNNQKNSEFDFALSHDDSGQLTPLIGIAKPFSLSINLGSKDYSFYRQALTGKRMAEAIDNPNLQIPTPRDLGEYMIQGGLKDSGLSLPDLSSLRTGLNEAHKEFPEITDIELSGGPGFHGQLKFEFKNKDSKIFTAKPLYKSEIREVGVQKLWEQSLSEYREHMKTKMTK